MNKLIILNFVIITLAIGISCNNQSQKEEIVTTNYESDLKALNDQLDEIEELCLDLKVESYMFYFHEDAVIFPPGQSTHSRKGQHC